MIDDREVASISSSAFSAGMVGLGTFTSAPCFDNLIVNEAGAASPPPTVFFQDIGFGADRVGQGARGDRR